MIKQLLLFKFKSDVSKETIDLFFKKYKELEKLEYLENVDFGENTSTEGFDKGFKYGAVASFKDKKNVDLFLNNSEHIELAEKYLNPYLEDFVLVEYEI